MGNITTQKSRDDQAAIMASTGVKVSDQVKAFDRYLGMLPATQGKDGQPVLNLCPHAARNGHITPEAAIRCAQAMAEAELASQPANVDLEARLASVAITVVSQPRFQCSKGCTFGHKTQGQAETCSQGSQARAARAVKDSIPVTSASVSLADLLSQASTAKATEAAREAAKASQDQDQPKASQGSQDQPKASQDQPKPKARLRSGSQGSTAKA